MKIRAIIPDEPSHASSWWRIVRPFKKLRELDNDTWFYYSGDVNYSDLYDAIVIIHRMIPANPQQYIKLLRDAKPKAIIYSMDDYTINTAILEAYLRSSGGLTNSQINDILERIPRQIEFINSCDGVLVSTQKLKYLVEEHLRPDMEITSLDNALDLHWYWDRLSTQALYRRNGNKVYIGYASGRRPEEDLINMTEAWNKIAKKYDNVWFVVAGFQHDIIDRNIPLDRKIRIPWAALNDWPKSMQVDIGCCPMQYTLFNEGKSPIKYFEYSMAGATVVASPFYANTILNRITGYIANGTSEWIAALEQLIEDKLVRWDKQDNAEYQISTLLSLDATIYRWIHYFESFL